MKREATQVAAPAVAALVAVLALVQSKLTSLIKFEDLEGTPLVLLFLFLGVGLLFLAIPPRSKKWSLGADSHTDSLAQLFGTIRACIMFAIAGGPILIMIYAFADSAFPSHVSEFVQSSRLVHESTKSDELKVFRVILADEQDAVVLEEDIDGAVIAKFSAAHRGNDVLSGISPGQKKQKQYAIEASNIIMLLKIYTDIRIDSYVYGFFYILLLFVFIAILALSFAEVLADHLLKAKAEILASSQSEAQGDNKAGET